MSMAPAQELSFYMAPASVHFPTLIFSIALVCLKLNGKEILSMTQN